MRQYAASSGPGMTELSTGDLVSIVIPCYNYGRYLPEAIESALGQTYSSIEIVIVDDGSTDDTQEVARRYPVSLITGEHRGVGAARNIGVRASRGSLFVPLDADDRLHPRYLERTLEVLQRAPQCSFAYTWTRYFGAWSGSLCNARFAPYKLVFGSFMPVTALIRREVFDAVGGYPEDLPYGEDWDFWISAAERGYRGTRVSEYLFLCRKHQSNAMAQIPEDRRRECRGRIRRNHPRMFSPWNYVLANLAAIGGNRRFAVMQALERLRRRV